MKDDFRIFSTFISFRGICHEVVAQVTVESSTSSIIKSKREPKVTFIDQLGTIGGTLGLFTGMSILSMIEVVLFLLKLLRSMFKGTNNKPVMDKIMQIFVFFTQIIQNKRDFFMKTWST